MRIREIRIEGFGRFAGETYGPLDGPVAIFFGPNEAGKSTLLEFVRAVLFGFRPKKGKVPPGGRPGRYPPLAGGTHGGALVLEGGDGRTFVVRRSQGGSSGRLTVASEAGADLGEAALAGLLGNHSRLVFERIFAFGLDELHSLDLLSDGNVNGQIYSAGMGATALPAALKAIQDRRRAIFLKRGSSNEMHGLGERLGRIDGGLSEVEGNAARYGELTARLERIGSDLAGLETGLKEARALSTHQEMLRAGWDDWNALGDAEAELARLPGVDDFPSDGVGRLERLEQRIEIARRERETELEAVDRARREAGASIDREAIAVRGAEMRRVREGRGAFESSIGDLPQREAELAGYRREFAESLRGLGPDWDENRLEEFDLSMAVRQRIAEHGDRMRAAAEESSRSAQALEQAREALGDLAREQERTRGELESLPAPGIDEAQVRERQRAVREASVRLSEVGRLRRTESDLSAQLDGIEAAAAPSVRPGVSIGIAALGVISCAVLVAAGVVLGGEALYLGIASGLLSGLVLISAAAYVSSHGRFPSLAAAGSPLAVPIRSSLRRAEADIAALETALARDAETLGLEAIDEATLLGAEESLREGERVLSERGRLSEALRTAGALAERRSDRVKRLAAVAEAAGRDLEAAREAWRGWLGERGLLESYTPETAEVLRGQVELCRSKLGDVREWKRRIAKIDRDIAGYAAVVGPLAEEFGVDIESCEHRSVAAAADRLIEIFERVQAEVRDRDRARLELEDAERRLEQRSQDLGRIEAELGDLLERGGAGTTEEFRDRAAVSERRTELSGAARNALLRLQRVSGPGEPLEALRADLAGTNPESISSALAELNERIEALDGRRKELLTERGSLENERGGLTGEEESSRLRMERGVLAEQVRDCARDWSRLTLAKGLLDRARERFERERQPGVVRHAQGFFERITGGRYRQLYAPLGEQTITVTDADGRTKQPAELSRGTREQLFLSLRFGLVRELGEATEPLPVVVDEVLVNFDPERARRAAGAFIELSRTNQVLVFTCQPQVVDQFRGAAADAGAAPPAVLEIG